jgi:altronate dehydratase large subunit
MMMTESFWGYPRKDGSVGIRNDVFILPVQRYMNMVSNKICEVVRGTKTITFTGEVGRLKADREVIGRTLTGLALNPNVAAVLLLATKRNHGYEEVNLERIKKAIVDSGKPVAALYLDEAGGFYNFLGQGIKIAREMVVEASRNFRQPFGLDKLSLSVKCGMSDATSGISGNPVVGRMFDKIVQAGGRAFFSETTEVIGAEHILVKKARDKNVAQKLLRAVAATENAALASGEDIRKTNPIPENIAGGISTLEEKSLGAIVKAGSQPIEDVLEYGQRPGKPGLYFLDAWMSVISLPVGFAAAGAQLMLFQMGGAGFPSQYPVMPGHSSGIVMPLMYVTGNSQAYQRAEDGMDFCSGTVLEGTETVEDASKRLLEVVLEIASGRMTKVETIKFQDPIEMYLKGPVF